MIRLSELEGQLVLDRGLLGLLPFAPLMQRPADVDAEAWLRQCIHRAQEMQIDEIVKANYLADLAILSGILLCRLSLALRCMRWCVASSITMQGGVAISVPCVQVGPGLKAIRSPP